MRTYLDCYPCFLRQALDAARFAGASGEQQAKVLQETLEMLQGIDPTTTPPEIGDQIHRRVREMVADRDPYNEVKRALRNRAQELAANLIRKTNLSAEEGTAFSAAFREAVDNANRHGHRSNEDRHIDVVFLLEPNRISITVEDEGEGFNWGYYLDQVKNLSPDKQAQLRREAGQRGGLGIMLMKKCTDVLEYVGKGNVVRLIKNLE